MTFVSSWTCGKIRRDCIYCSVSSILVIENDRKTLKIKIEKTESITFNWIFEIWLLSIFFMRKYPLQWTWNSSFFFYQKERKKFPHSETRSASVPLKWSENRSNVWDSIDCRTIRTHHISEAIHRIAPLISIRTYSYRLGGNCFYVVELQIAAAFYWFNAKSIRHS